MRINDNGFAESSDIIDGLDWVSANRVLPAIANISYGTNSAAITTAINGARGRGISVTVSAGNDGDDACGATSGSPGAVVVAATRADDYRAGFSNHGTCVDIFAPGNALRLATNSNSTATAVVNGTSFAAPFAAGVLANIYDSQGTISPDSARAILLRSATQWAVIDAQGSPNLLVNALHRSASISGPTAVSSRSYAHNVSWSAAAAGGDGSYSYQWRASVNGGPFAVVGSGSTYTRSIGAYESSNLVLIVAATSFGAAATDTISVPITPNYFSVYAEAPTYVTEKATYALNGSASHTSTAWRWDQLQSGSYQLWEASQNSALTAYAGEYILEWRLFAQRVSDASTGYGYSTTEVCISSPGCEGPPPVVVSRVTDLSRDEHYGAGAVIAFNKEGSRRVVQLYSLRGHDSRSGIPRDALEASSVVQRSPTGDVEARFIRTTHGAQVESFQIQAVADDLRSFALALDPDLGRSAADDLLGRDDSTGLVWVRDGRAGAVIAYLATGLPADAQPWVRQFSTRRTTWYPDLEDGIAVEQELSARSHRIFDEPDDVRFFLTLPGFAAVNGQARVYVIRASSLDEARESARAILTVRDT